MTVTFAGSVLASTGASGRRALETTTSRVSITSSDCAATRPVAVKNKVAARIGTQKRCRRNLTMTSLRLEGLYRNIRQLGVLTRGSSFPCAFPCAETHSDFCAGSLPAYSGGTVMALHHLPRR